MSESPAEQPVKQSFGAQLFPGAPPADDCATAPDQIAPDSWIALFASHADAATWMGLLTSSAAGRDFTLQRAPKASLLLNCGPGQQPQYARLGQALDKRVAGGQHTAARISLHPEGRYPGEAGLPAFLAEWGAGVAELQIVFQATAAAWLDPAGTGEDAPDSYPAVLPGPPHLAQLRSLRIAATLLDAIAPYGAARLGPKQERVIAEASRFLPQLTSLELTWAGGPWWSLVFTPGLQAPHLTHLTTDTELDDYLMRLLLDRASKLAHLSVSRIGTCCKAFASRRYAPSRTSTLRPCASKAAAQPLQSLVAWCCCHCIVLYCIVLLLSLYSYLCAGKRWNVYGSDRSATLQDYTDKRWLVHDVCVMESGDLSMLARLPRCEDDTHPRLTLTGQEYMCVYTAQVRLSHINTYTYIQTHTHSALADLGAHTDMLLGIRRCVAFMRSTT